MEVFCVLWIAIGRLKTYEMFGPSEQCQDPTALTRGPIGPQDLERPRGTRLCCEVFEHFLDAVVPALFSRNYRLTVLPRVAYGSTASHFL